MGNFVSSVEVVAIVLLFIAEHNESMVKEILEALPPAYSQQVLRIMRQKRLFNESQVTEALSIFHKLVVDKSVLYLSEDLSQELDDFSGVDIQDSDSQMSDLNKISDKVLKEMMEKEGFYFWVLLCHLLGSDRVSSLLSDQDPAYVQNVIKAYLNDSPYSSFVLSSMRQFLLEATSNDVLKTTVDTEKVCEIVESLPEVIIQLIQQQNDPDFGPVLESMARVEDIVQFDDITLSRLMDHFTEPKDLVVLKSYLPEEILSLIWAKITDRLQSIVEEEEMHYKPTEADQLQSKQQVLRVIRQLKKEGSK